MNRVNVLGDRLRLTIVFSNIIIAYCKNYACFPFLLMAMLFGTCFTSFAQVTLYAPSSPFFEKTDSQKLSLDVNSLSFFKNNEYFNELNPGYTLIGTIFSPTLEYRPGTDTRLEAGWSFLKYDGRNGFYNSEPIFRFQYQPVQWFQMVLGTLYGGQQHGFIEPLYQWERAFTHPVENGLQFLFDSERIKADVWLEWKKFIVQQDPFQEQLLFGTTASFNLFSRPKAVTLSIPFQTTIEHHGGQINLHDSLTPPMQTIANLGTAIKVEWKPNTGFIKYISAECWFLGYHDLSPQKLQAYKKGEAIYPKSEIRSKHFSLQCGYFSGNQFQASTGDPLFLSANIPYSGVKFKTHQLITTKLVYSKVIGTGIAMGAYFESYSNLAASELEYAYGVHLSLNREFFLAKIR